MIAGDGAVVWLTGLPSSGKSTLARAVKERLTQAGKPSCVLDSDAVRGLLRPSPGYSERARDEFYETLARLAAMLAAQGLVVIVAATAHKAQYRARARALTPHFVEVYVASTREQCEARDSKGLYSKARAGEISGLPGKDEIYEPPQRPDAVADGGLDQDAAERVAELALLATGALQDRGQ